MADATIGALRVVLGADTGTFEDGLKKAESALGKFGTNVSTIAKGIGLEKIIEKSLTEAIGFVKDSFREIEQIGQEAQKIGVGVEILSGLKLAAELAEVSFEQLSGSLGRFNKHISETASGTGDAEKQ